MSQLNQAAFGLNRRRFLQATGALAAGFSLNADNPAQAQSTKRLTLAEWKPCFDVAVTNADTSNDLKAQPTQPVRTRKDDPLSLVDMALIDQNPGLSGLLSVSDDRAQAQAAQEADSGRVAARALGLPNSGPAHLAAKNRWTTSELKVFFYGGSGSLASQVMKIASKWSQFAKIDFSETKDRLNANIRVAFAGTGHWSYIGPESMSVGGQTMNLQFAAGDVIKESDYNHGVVLHEFGHALGCIHEHLQPNAGRLFKNDQVVLDYYRRTYGWDANKTRLNVLHRYDESQLLRGMVSGFDRLSIMLYANPGEITLDPAGTPRNIVLSVTDQEYISKLYPGRFTPTTTTDPNTPAPVTTSTPRELIVGGEPVEGAITRSAPLSRFNFSVAKSGTYRIESLGSTKVWFTLKDEAGKEIKTEWQSDDLVNPIGYPALAAGKYTLEVAHWYPGKGAGEFAVQIFEPKQ